MNDHICPADHGHAVNSNCYTHHRCRCFPCRLANAERSAQYRAAAAHGEAGRTSPDLAREHIRGLQAWGFSYRRIAAIAGVSDQTVYLICDGRLQYIHAATSRKILAVELDLDLLEPNAFIPARGVVRRVRALGTLGWSVAAVAAEAGMTRAFLAQCLCHDRLSVRNHRAIAGVYERLWNTTPPTTTATQRATVAKTLRRAAAEGWAPPLAWDDIDTDPAPSVAPQPAGDDVDVDVVAVDLVMEGARLRLNRDERHIAVRVLHARGLNDQEIAPLLDVCDRTIFRDREYLGLPAVEGPHITNRKAMAA